MRKLRLTQLAAHPSPSSGEILVRGRELEEPVAEVFRLLPKLNDLWICHCPETAVCDYMAQQDAIFNGLMVQAGDNGVKPRKLRCDLTIGPLAWMYWHASDIPVSPTLALLEELDLTLTLPGPTDRSGLHVGDYSKDNMLSGIRELKVLVLRGHPSANCDIEAFLTWLVRHRAPFYYVARRRRVPWNSPYRLPPELCFLRSLTLKSVTMRPAILIKVLEQCLTLQDCVLERVSVIRARVDMRYRSIHGGWHALLGALSEHYENPHAVVSFRLTSVLETEHGSDNSEGSPVLFVPFDATAPASTVRLTFERTYEVPDNTPFSLARLSDWLYSAKMLMLNDE